MTAGDIDPLTTAAACRLLSLGLSRPDREGLLLLARLAGAVGEEELVEAAASADPDEAAAEHEALFGSDGRCLPYETDYEPDPFRRTRQLADLAGFYRAFGAQAGGPEAERPDHAGCELEFLAFLALRRSERGEAGDAVGVQVCAQAEEAFLRDHAGRWLPAFFADLEQAAACPLYRALARAGARLLAEELARRDLEVTAPARRAPAAGPVEDAMTCGDACGSAALTAHGRAVG